METHREEACVTKAVRFVQRNRLRVVACSALLLIPCFWHKRIEAGDLGSHVYNAWLAQLIERGQAPGLYVARQWNNVAFDWLLVKFGNAVGLVAAQKIVVPLCVLVFFWGAFALIAAVSRRAPWALLPCLFMLAYGWTFNVGFFNYYLSLGLGFFATAILWLRALGGDEIREWNKTAVGWDAGIFALLAGLVFVAHPQGFVWLAGSSGYVLLWSRLGGRWKWIVGVAAVLFVAVARFYLTRHYEAFPVWGTFGWGVYNGSDQIVLYSRPYYLLSGAALAMGIACFAVDRMSSREGKQPWSELRLPLELHCFVVFTVYVLPDAVRVPLYSGWVGALAVRLTTVAAVTGLAVLAFCRVRWWHTAGFALVAAVFFAFLYRDTGTLNRMETQIEDLVATLPHGERVTATIWAPDDSRLPFLQHLMDRACVGHCFSYQNYEPASGQFRVRVEAGSPVAVDDPDLSQQMESGEYVVEAKDLPMAQIYQCDEDDLTRLCMRPLAAGEANGRVGYHP